MGAEPPHQSGRWPGSSVHIGRRLHYRLASNLIARGPRRVVLMQRSSTLLLGPETGWRHEAGFYQAAWRSIDQGATWFHVASLPGIRRHLLRETSVFPHVDEATSRMEIREGVICLPGPGSTGQEIRILPEEGWVRGDEDFKFDRQARLVAADFGDGAEALVVSDIGDQQVTVHIEGTAALDLLELVVSFYQSCPPLRAEQLDWSSSTTGSLIGGSTP